MVLIILVAILTISSFIIIKWNKKKVQLVAILEYFKELADEKLIESRTQVLNKKNENINYELQNCKDETTVCDFLNKWGYMVKYNYLPFNMFKGSTGTEVMQLYISLSGYIEYRKKDNTEYCKEFVYLYYRIKNNTSD